MSDALDYMNQVTQWDDPPLPDQQWELAVARACEIIVARDAEIERLRAVVEKRTQDRNEALAVCYAVEEWMDGRISSSDLRTTAKAVIDSWAAEAASVTP